MDELVLSALRDQKDLAGVFEHDGETSYFYLYKTGVGSESRIIGAIQIPIAMTAAVARQLQVTWNKGDSEVGLFLSGKALAFFNVPKDLAELDHCAGVLTSNVQGPRV